MTSERSVSPEKDELVVRARHSRDAFASLFDEYYPRILRYCRLRLGDRHAAEDATSDAFLQAAKHIKSFAGSTDVEFRCWLFRIASNAVNAQFRRVRNRRETACSFDPTAVSSSAVELHDEWVSVSKAMQTLDDRAQHMLALRFLEQRSYEEIAEGLQMTPGAVRTAVSRALGELRRLLGAKLLTSGESVSIELPRNESVP